MSPKNKERRERRSPYSARRPTQPFYSQLLRMLKQEPMIIQANAKNLYNPVDPQLKSQIAAKTDLMACIVSGKN